MRFNKKLFAIPAVLMVIVLVVLVVSTVAKSTLEVDLSLIDNPSLATVTLDGEYLEPTGSGGSLFRITTSPGSKNLEITHPRYNIYSEKLNLGIGSKNLQPELVVIDEKNAALLAYKSSLNVDISGEKFFSENTWLVFFATAKTQTQDTTTVVSRYDNVTNEWVLVAEGTVLFPEDIFEEIPEDVRLYLESL